MVAVAVQDVLDVNSIIRSVSDDSYQDFIVKYLDVFKKYGGDDFKFPKAMGEVRRLPARDCPCAAARHCTVLACCRRWT